VSGNALIIGCGYLGKVLARQLLEEGLHVIGTVRRDSSVEALHAIGIEAVSIDITTSGGLRHLVELCRTRAVGDLYCCLPPSIDADPAAVFTAVAAALRPLPLRRALLTSSTAV
jgi:nucleoside-diphosphate-sugar epimerase